TAGATPGSFTYTPEAGFIGVDEIEYEVCESPSGVCATAVWRIEVLSPLAGNTTSATDDYVNTYGTNAGVGNVLSNDVDPQGDGLTVISAGTYESRNAAHQLQGTLVLAADGSYTFTAEPGFVGTAVFPYTVEDDGVPAAQASATLYITVTEPNPKLILEKSGQYIDSNSDGQINSGDQIKYSFRVYNKGNLTINNLIIEDKKISANALAVTPSTLAPGQVGTAEYI